jgi:hypothetical protein
MTRPPSPDPNDVDINTPESEEIDYFEAQTEELVNDVILNKDTENLVDAVDRTELAEANRLDQANNLRQKFFWFGVVAASTCVLTSCYMAIHLTVFKMITAPTVIVFISGLTIEVLGIIAIIANYLFPKGRP